jgi:hypothetical protein
MNWRSMIDQLVSVDPEGCLTGQTAKYAAQRGAFIASERPWVQIPPPRQETAGRGLAPTTFDQVFSRPAA